MKDTISSTVFSSPPEKEYLVSHQEQSRLHPTDLTKTVGTPMSLPSPWRERNISLISMSLVLDLVLVAGFPEALQPQPAGVALAAGLLPALVA